MRFLIVLSAATACFGNDASQFPTNNLFAAAGDGIWDNGASCGRQYLVRCISAATPGTCNPSQTIQIRIVDRAETSVSRPSANGATIILSNTAFGAIANPSAASKQSFFLFDLCEASKKQLMICLPESHEPHHLFDAILSLSSSSCSHTQEKKKTRVNDIIDGDNMISKIFHAQH